MDSGFISQCGPRAGKVKCLPPPRSSCLSSKSGAPHAAVCGDCAVPRCLDRSQPLLWPTFSVWCLTLFINPGVCHSGTETWDGSGGTRKGGRDEGRTSCWICVSVLNGACHTNGWSSAIRHTCWLSDVLTLCTPVWTRFVVAGTPLINMLVDIKAAYNKMYYPLLWFCSWLSPIMTVSVFKWRKNVHLWVCYFIFHHILAWLNVSRISY